MEYKIDHDLHIHSQLSKCSSDPEQNKENIFKYAEDNGLSTICITDHYWDRTQPGASEWYRPQDFEHISNKAAAAIGKCPIFIRLRDRNG